MRRTNQKSMQNISEPENAVVRRSFRAAFRALLRLHKEHRGIARLTRRLAKISREDSCETIRNLFWQSPANWSADSESAAKRRADCYSLEKIPAATATVFWLAAGLSGAE